MCARFRSVAEMQALVALYGLKVLRNFEYNPNVAPTDSVPIIRDSKSQGRGIQIASFGLIPGWSTDKKSAYKFINCRSETIQKKPVFRKAFETRRCVVPAEGFYEWKEEDGKKIPYMVHRKDNRIFSMAGLWDYAEIEDEKIFSFSIITGPPSKLTEELHHRTPIILQDANEWLSNGGTSQFVAPNDNELTITKKNPLMNKTTIKQISKIDLPG